MIEVTDEMVDAAQVMLPQGSASFLGHKAWRGCIRRAIAAAFEIRGKPKPMPTQEEIYALLDGVLARYGLPSQAELAAPARSVGCVCPAGANVACQRADCPRKPLPGSV